MGFSLWKDGWGVRSRKDGCTEGIRGLWCLEYDGHYSFIHLTSLQLVSDGSGSPVQLWTNRKGRREKGVGVKEVQLRGGGLNRILQMFSDSRSGQKGS